VTQPPNAMPPGDDDLHDAGIDALWDASRADGPSPAIDAALRAEARRAVNAGPVRASRVAEATRPERWWGPIAAAAAIGAVAVGVLQLMPPPETATVTDMPAVAGPAKPDATRERDLKSSGQAPAAPAPSNATPSKNTSATPPPSSLASPASQPQAFPDKAPPQQAAAPRANDKLEAAQSSPASPAPAGQAAGGTAAAPSRDARPAEAPAGMARKRLEDSVRRDAGNVQSAPENRVAPEAPAAPQAQVAPETPAPPRAPAAPQAPAPAAAPPAAAVPSPTPAAASPPAAAPQAFPSPAGAIAPLAKRAAPEPKAAMEATAPRPMDEWITLIRRLRDEARYDDAARELAAFRAAYPRREALPEDLRDWQPPTK